MKKFLILLISICLLFYIAACGTTAQNNNNDTKQVQINIGQDPYNLSLLSINIIKILAEERGYDVNITNADVGFLYLGLANGDIDIYPDTWPSLHSSYLEDYEDQIEIAGTVTDNIPFGMAVPSFANFDSIDDLKNNADELGNIIYGIEPGSGMMLTAEKTLDAYELNDYFELMPSSTTAMLGQVEVAIDENRPVVFLAWRLHTMFAKYDIKLLEDPKEVWGSDKMCIGANPNFKEKAPDMYTFIQNFNLSIEEVENALFKMEDEGATMEDLAHDWINNNSDKIEQMFNQ